jgi:hypothetical protein
MIILLDGAFLVGGGLIVYTIMGELRRVNIDRLIGSDGRHGRPIIGLLHNSLLDIVNGHFTANHFTHERLLVAEIDVVRIGKTQLDITAR